MRLLITLLFAFLMVHASSGTELRSPDGKLVLVTEIKSKLDENGTRLYYSVQYNNQKVILDSPIALELKESGPISNGLKIIGSNVKTIKDRWSNSFGKNSQITDHCNELTLNLQEQYGVKRKINIIFRVYNDGIAFRYQIPEQEGVNTFELVSERTEFVFPGNHQVWAADYNGFKSHQESEFEITTLNDLKPKRPMGLPMLVKVADKL